MSSAGGAPQHSFARPRTPARVQEGYFAAAEELALGRELDPELAAGAADEVEPDEVEPDPEEPEEDFDDDDDDDDVEEDDDEALDADDGLSEELLVERESLR